MKNRHPFPTVGIVAKPHSPRARAILRRLLSVLDRRGVRFFCDPATAVLLGEKGRARTLPVLAESVSLMLVLGGDGTLLGVARNMPARPVPVLGINLGSLGFLTETTVDELESVLVEILEGRFEVEQRMMLQAQVMRGRKVASRQRLLNDSGVAVVHGAAYGPGGEGTLRVSFGSGGDTLARGLAQLRDGLRAL